MAVMVVPWVLGDFDASVNPGIVNAGNIVAAGKDIWENAGTVDGGGVVLGVADIKEVNEYCADASAI